jgi:hypothetical protein
MQERHHHWIRVLDNHYMYMLSVLSLLYSLIRLILFCLCIFDKTVMSSPWWLFLFLVQTARKIIKHRTHWGIGQPIFLQIQSFLANSAGFRETKNHLGVNIEGYLFSVLLNMVLKKVQKKLNQLVWICWEHNIRTSPTSTLYLIQGPAQFLKKRTPRHHDSASQLDATPLLQRLYLYLPEINVYLILRNPTRERLNNQPNLTLRSSS